MNGGVMRSVVDCTNCGRGFVVELDLELDGNHTIPCPVCRHDHYRVVRGGEVTEDRWRSSMQTYVATTYTTTSTAPSWGSWSAVTTAGTSAFTHQLWLDRSDLDLPRDRSS
jgi:hypothetical protein